MRVPYELSAVIRGCRYSVATATLVASDHYWDGHSWDRNGRNQFLFRTPRGAFFALQLTRWMRERDCIIPLSRDEALELYEHLPEHALEYDQAFGAPITDA